MASNNDDGNDRNDTHSVSPDSASETTPLLMVSPVATISGSDTLAAEDGESCRLLGRPEDKPLPKLQIFLLCYARLVEPIAFFSIFPYINQMVQENGHCMFLSSFSFSSSYYTIR